MEALAPEAEALRIEHQTQERGLHWSCFSTPNPFPLRSPASAGSDLLADKVRASDQAAIRRRYGTKAPPWLAAFKKEMEFERAFSQAGGLLLAGLDRSGMGGAVFLDSRFVTTSSPLLSEEGNR
jgi:hypothetical protein